MLTNSSIDVCGDTETFPNCFTLTLMPLAREDDTVWTYEISERRNDGPVLAYALRSGYFRRMYGFNNVNFDGPVINTFLELADVGMSGKEMARVLWMKANDIIQSADRWSHRVKPWEEVVKQVDLFLIHHFDNPAKATSLKKLEFAMRSRSIRDLPFPPNTVLTFAEMDVLRAYNVHDVRETKQFAWLSMPQIEFREKLGEKFLNQNDTKLGMSFFVERLERKSPGSCYGPDRKPRQTWRDSIALADVIFPYIKFTTPEANAVLDTLRAKVLSPVEIENASEGPRKIATKGVFKGLTATIKGFTFVFGTGGLHGSVSNRVIIADAEHEIVDIDVTGYYPNIAVANRLFPEHLGPAYCEVAFEIMTDRTRAKDAGDTVTADAYKLANNGTFGNTNSAHSPVYDPKYTMAVTVNGQLMLVMLAEPIMEIPGAELIQANTDGLTVRLPRSQRPAFDAICKWWQDGTAMRLEETQYSRMFIRDVNSYIAESSKGYKLKNAYDFELKLGSQKAWYKDHSALVVAKGAFAALVHGQDPLDFLLNHDDPWDFLLLAKAPGGSHLELSDGTKLQKHTRYYVAGDGLRMTKVMPPLAKAPDKWRRIGIHAQGQADCSGKRGAYTCSTCGESFQLIKDFEVHNEDVHSWKVKVLDEFDGGSLPGLNINYYLREIEKLLLQ